MNKISEAEIQDKINSKKAKTKNQLHIIAHLAKNCKKKSKE